MAVPSSKIRFYAFTNPVSGNFKAITALDLHILGLPGARLPKGTSIPGVRAVQLIARRGPSYASTALVWQTSVPALAFTGLVELGSACRLPVCIQFKDVKRISLLLIYLPPYQANSGKYGWDNEI